MSHSLNIISFDIPFPANYGGVIDVYYKLLWLKQEGVKIHLHCFSYGRKPSKELEALCEKVYYYERRTGFFANVSLTPYTVKSRQSRELEANLLSNDFPILFEVLHTCYLLNDPRFKDRKKIYRHSNIEHDYYRELSKTEKGLIKKIYLLVEAWKLKRFESIVNYADLILAVNQKDANYFQRHYPQVKSVYLPSFHPSQDVTVQAGRGNYLLFHGNLSISENYEALSWLIAHVFSKTEIPVIVAGLDPPGFLTSELRDHPRITLRESPDDAEMMQLLSNAQAHILYTAQPTGLKLKLLNVLFKGRFVVCNSHMLSGTGLKADRGLLIADSPDDYIALINACFPEEFSEALILERKKLIAHFDNASNAKKLIREVFD